MRRIYVEDEKGFTLMELVTVVAIMAIVISIAYPSMMHMLCNMEAKRIHKTIYSVLREARATSYIQRRYVFMCLADANMLCHKNASNHLLLFTDVNGNNTFDDGVDRIIMLDSLKLKYAIVRLATGGRRHYVRFSKDTGTPRGFMGHIKYCPTHDYNNKMYKISFNMVGLFRYKPNSSSEPTGC